MLPGAACIEDRGGAPHASPDGNACSLDAEAFAICVAGRCVVSRCGDGVVDTRLEACDDPLGNSELLPDRCRPMCQPARCGDGVPDTGEECDDGNFDESDVCLNTCKRNLCGDTGKACAAGQVCVGDVCRDACIEDTDCDSDRLCDQGFCAPKIPPQISFSPSTLSIFVGARAAEITPIVETGPQAAVAIVSWSWIVVPEGFSTAAPPDGPTLLFSPDIVGYYALQATATHRGGSNENLFVINVTFDSIAGVSTHDAEIFNLVRLRTDGSELILFSDAHLDDEGDSSFYPHAGLAPVGTDGALLFSRPNLEERKVWAEALPVQIAAQVTEVDCVNAGKVWAITPGPSSDACCPAGSAERLLEPSQTTVPGRRCCKAGFEPPVKPEEKDKCVVTTDGNGTSILTRAVPDSVVRLVEAPNVLVGPSGSCAWGDVPPAAVNPDNVQVVICQYGISRMSASDDGERVAYRVRRLPTRTDVTAALAVIAHDTDPAAPPRNPINGGLPDPAFVIHTHDVPVSEFGTLPFDYVRLAHDPSGTRLAVLMGPAHRAAGDDEQPSPVGDYDIEIFDPVSHASLALVSRTMRTSWHAAMILLPQDRLVISPDGYSVTLSAAGGGAPIELLWEAPARPDYPVLPATHRASLACAPLCAAYAGPPPFMTCGADECCKCLLDSNEMDPVAACETAVAGGASGIAVSLYEGIARNKAGTRLIATKKSWFIPGAQCTSVFALDSGALEQKQEIVTYELSSAVSTHYSVSDLTGSDAERDMPSAGFLADDSQLYAKLEPELWVFNSDGSRPRQLLPTGPDVDFETQINDPLTCRQGGTASWLALSLLALRRFRRRSAQRSSR